MNGQKKWEATLGEQTPACTSTKPITGHCLGATAALEAILCIQSLRKNRIPPTPNYSQPDSAIDLDIVHGEARDALVGHVLSTSLGFWGNHACLSFSAI